MCVSVCVRECVCEGERVCVRVRGCVCEGERVCVCESVCVRVRGCVCVRVRGWMRSTVLLSLCAVVGASCSGVIHPQN